MHLSLNLVYFDNRDDSNNNYSIRIEMKEIAGERMNVRLYIYRAHFWPSSYLMAIDSPNWKLHAL